MSLLYCHLWDVFYPSSTITMSCLYNIFTYQGSLYRQIRGLAMGSRLSGTLAIIVMDRFERAHIYDQLTPTSTVYVRYVDDANTTANDKAEAKAILTLLNTKYPTIKFELAFPEEDRKTLYQTTNRTIHPQQRRQWY